MILFYKSFIWMSSRERHLQVKMEGRKRMQYTSIYQSPIGEILLACDETGLTGLWLSGAKFYALGINPEHEEKEMSIFKEVKGWLDIDFSGKEPDFTPKLHMIGSPFQLSVWKILQQIPYGQTTTLEKLPPNRKRKRLTQDVSTGGRRSCWT